MMDKRVKFKKESSKDRATKTDKVYMKERVETC